MKTCALVSGDFTPGGGMDRANYELAWHLAEREGVEVHIAAHRVAEPLAGHRNVRWHPAPKPLDSYTLGAPCLARTGRIAAQQAERVIVNGGNCQWPDVNWVHYVHAAAKDGIPPGSSLYRLRKAWEGARHRRAERRCLESAALVVTVSDLARRHVMKAYGVPPENARTVYYGVDSEVFRPASSSERAAARRRLGLSADAPAAAFVGALSPDRRKGFDVLFSAWEELCREPAWDGLLVVAGGGSELEAWERTARKNGLSGRIRFLGYTNKVPDVLAACDVFASPTRYEEYGSAILEALSCGLPAIVTASAGIAERYPEDLRDLLLPDPPEAGSLARVLRAWRKDLPGFRSRVAPFSQELRRRTWIDMSREIADLLRSPVHGHPVS